MGLICIASDAEGLKENISDNITGYIVKKRDPFKLYQKIEFILNQEKNVLNKIEKKRKEIESKKILILNCRLIILIHFKK